MQKQIFSLLGVMALVVGVMGFVMAFDANSPYTVTLQWIVPEDTSFTVTLAGAEVGIDFDDNVASSDEILVEPDSQDNSTSTPILTITNTGNLDLNFSNNLTAAKPAWAILYSGNTTSPGDAQSFDTTAVQIVGNVASEGTADIYMWTTISSADEGTTERTYQINSYKEIP